MEMAARQTLKPELPRNKQFEHPLRYAPESFTVNTPSTEAESSNTNQMLEGIFSLFVCAKFKY